MTDNYTGNELELFAKATNWKHYFSRLIKPYIGSNVLEVGAGIGSNIPFLNHSNVEKWQCLEPDPNFCEEICKKLIPLYENIRVKKGTIESIDKQYDSIIYLDVIEHLKDDKIELKKASQLLNNKGYLIILVPAHEFLFSEFDKNIGHYRRYNKSRLKKALPPNIKIQSIKYLDSIGLFASLSNKLLFKQSLPSHNQIKFWDQFLVPISKISDKLCNYQLGKSLLIIGRKK